MRIFWGLIHLVWKLTWTVVVLLLCLALAFILYKGNQPMSAKNGGRRTP